MEKTELMNLLKDRRERMTKKDRRYYKDNDPIVGYDWMEGSTTPTIFQENKDYLYSVGILGHVTIWSYDVKKEIKRVD